MTLSDFDLDLSFGQEGENLVKELLTQGKTIEVKRDRRWIETNNIFIETECWMNGTMTWEKSGLSVSKADYWAFVLEAGVMMVPRYCVEWAVNIYGRPVNCNIEPNNSRGFLIRLDNLHEALKELA